MLSGSRAFVQPTLSVGVNVAKCCKCSIECWCKCSRHYDRPAPACRNNTTMPRFSQCMVSVPKLKYYTEAAISDICDTCNNDIYFRHIFPNMRFWYSASLPSQQWNTNQGENVSVIAIKVAIKCYDKPKITYGTSGTGLEKWKLVGRSKSFCADKGSVWCDYNGQSVGIVESIYSRSIVVCHQEWPRCGRQVVLSYSPAGD